MPSTNHRRSRAWHVMSCEMTLPRVFATAAHRVRLVSFDGRLTCSLRPALIPREAIALHGSAVPIRSSRSLYCGQSSAMVASAATSTSASTPYTLLPSGRICNTPICRVLLVRFTCVPKIAASQWPRQAGIPRERLSARKVVDAWGGCNRCIHAPMQYKCSARCNIVGTTFSWPLCPLWASSASIVAIRSR